MIRRPLHTAPLRAAAVPIAEARYKVLRPVLGWSVAPGDVLHVRVYADATRELAYFAAVDVHGHRDGHVARPVRGFPGWLAFEAAVADGALVRMGALKLEDWPP